jgi:hypothetical protein
MLRCGSGSAAQTCTGASGAPMTPSSSLRSLRLPAAAAAPEPAPAPASSAGARVSWSWPRTHRPHPPSFLAEPPQVAPGPASGSGPSMSGASAALPPPRRRSAAATSAALDADRRRARPGDSPRATSSRSAEKKPCLLASMDGMEASGAARAAGNGTQGTCRRIGGTSSPSFPRGEGVGAPPRRLRCGVWRAGAWSRARIYGKQGKPRGLDGRRRRAREQSGGADCVKQRECGRLRGGVILLGFPSPPLVRLPPTASP